MDIAVIGGVLGGAGLFLLGMRLMTDGIRLAAGHALRGLLERWTRTSLRGVLLGVLITALMQSSSAVTVALIGFTNAGLLSLEQAVGIVYGSNVGTTMTAWLVSTVGLKLDVQALAPLLVGVGMLLRLGAGERRRGFLGEALAGFGVFFLGIGVLESAFAHVGAGGWFQALLQTPHSPWWFAAAGALLTVLLQSSSAALALVLTAAAGGVLPLAAAAAVVVGANVGTTVTAVLAVIGATSAARRVAGAHVAFNLLTALAAMFALPVLLPALAALPWSVPVVLALFHTVFNVAGVLLMWPLSRPLVRFLERRFRTAEEDESRPRYLDGTLLSAPSLALNALILETGRVGAMARRMAAQVLAPGHERGALVRSRAALETLMLAVGEYGSGLRRTSLNAETAAALPEVLRVTQYYASMAELATELTAARDALEPIAAAELATALERFLAEAAAVVDGSDPAAAAYAEPAASARIEALEAAYQDLKAALLVAGTDRQVPIPQMVLRLDQISHVRRLAEQAAKGARHLHALAGRVATPAKEGAGDV